MIERLEAALKKALEEPFARLFPGKLHPLELAAGLRDTARDSRVRTEDGTFVANSYVIHLSESAHGQLAGIGDTVCAELAGHLRSYADAEQWQIGPYVSVELQVDRELAQGRMRLEAHFAPCPQTAYLQVEAGLTGGGKFFVGIEAVIGRGSGCDIVIDSSEVSRRHCRVAYRYVQYEVEDLDSANGTFVNGQRVEKAALLDRDLVEIGLVQLRFFVE